VHGTLVYRANRCQWPETCKAGRALGVHPDTLIVVDLQERYAQNSARPRRGTSGIGMLASTCSIVELRKTKPTPLKKKSPALPRFVAATAR